jgi:hypothetical protein
MAARHHGGQRESAGSLLLLFNAHGDPVTFVLPAERFVKPWEGALDTATGGIADYQVGASPM